MPLFQFMSNQSKGKIMKQVFLNAPEDCQWLVKTHLGNRTDLKFGSFILYGNEDAPDSVDLFADTDPLVTDEPHRITFL